MLVSLFIVTYNQRRFIAEAIEHALRQDYSPLEIVVSDDCSTDDTWSVIQATVTGYSGPHEVRLRRNARNLGLPAHLNAVWAECKGEWLVAAAGDDTSHASRVSRIVDAVRANPAARVVQSWVNEVDEAGRPIRLNTHEVGAPAAGARSYGLADRLDGPRYAPHGAAMAYSRELVDVFGPLPSVAAYEDNVVNIRGELLGRVLVLPEALVDHRNHPGQVTRLEGDAETRRRRLDARLRSDVATAAQNLTDLERARVSLDPTLHVRARRYFARRETYFRLKRLALCGWWPARVLGLAAIGPLGSRVARLTRDECLRSALPGPIYDMLRR